MAYYCPLGETFRELWEHRGLSECILDTRILSLINLPLILFVCVLHLWFMRKPTSFNHYSLLDSEFYRLQMFSIRAMALLELILLTLDLTKYLNPTLPRPHSSFALLIAERILIWPVACLIMYFEQRYSSLSPKVKQHNLGLPILFIWFFVTINISLVNIWSKFSFFRLRTFEHAVGFVIYLIQYFFSAVVVAAIFFAPGVPYSPTEKFKRLLGQQKISYSSSNEHIEEGQDDDEYAGLQPRKRSVVETTVGWASSLKVLTPFIWPSNNVLLQVYIYLCMCLFVLVRIANTYVPIYSKLIVDSMLPPNKTTNQAYNFSVIDEASHDNNGEGFWTPMFRWDLILIYVGLKIAQGGSAGTGLINCISTLMWEKVEQFTCLQLKVQLFEHLHSLSIRWHLQRRTGAVLRAMDRGSEGFTNILTYIVFSIIPIFVDITIAIIYFTAVFSGWIGFVVFVTIVVYVISTFCMTEWRSRVNRDKNTADNAMNQFSLDTLINAETIKDCASEEHQRDKYAVFAKEFLKYIWYFNLSSSLNDMIQLIIINAGFLAGSLLCVHAIVHHEEGLTAGDYVLFGNYLNQLFEPLNNFGKSYKNIQKSFVDMENMLEIFKEQNEVKDVPDATPLKITGGRVEFRDVSFSYLPGKTVLKRLTFIIPAGKSLAVVGPSGGGKTSITRLMLRFYDPQSGKILIDGQNIKKVTAKSLRKVVGVVPQDTCLFNDTLRYNIKFPRPECTDEEMFEAAKVACINKRILSFPTGYDTMVGERGTKLSGGEKQRVSIARAVVKNPAVIILDEATSSLDTHTERKIQSSLQRLCENRTSIIVAHRLSTVVHADQIIVLKNGRIHESGTHEVLLAKQGLYASMWGEQLKLQPEK